MNDERDTKSKISHDLKSETTSPAALKGFET